LKTPSHQRKMEMPSNVAQPLFEGSSSSGNGKASNALLKFLAQHYQLNNANDLIYFDPLAFDGLKSFTRARERIKTIPVEFEGSAAGFDSIAGKYPVRMTIAQMLDGNIKSLLPRPQKAKDRDQGVVPGMYNIDEVYINSILLASPLNTMPFGVAVCTNGVPKSYENERRQQIKDLEKQLDIPAGVDTDKTAHIPPSPPGSKPDTRPIKLLNEVVNGYHAKEVTKTFGGITYKHMWKGLIPLEPKLAMQLGLSAPPANHEPNDPPPGCEREHNSWVIVPIKHVLGQIANLTASSITKFDYCVYQLLLPNNAKIPFLLMDMWTMRRYADSTMEHALVKVQVDRTSLPQLYIELKPLATGSWVNGCMSGQHYHVGKVSFNLIVSYVMFPKGFKDDPRLVCALSDAFPRLSVEMRDKLDTTDRTQLKIDAAQAKEEEQSQKPSRQKKVTIRQDDDGGGGGAMDTGGDDDDTGIGNTDWGTF